MLLVAKYFCYSQSLIYRDWTKLFWMENGQNREI